jgi:nitrite reductase (NADH) large subunit
MDCFEPLCEATKETAQAQEACKVVIVGAGIAGLAAAEAVRAASRDSEVMLISKETSLPYYRLNLTRYLAGEITKAELPIKPQDWFIENQIQLLLGDEVSRLRLDQKTAELHKGDKISFDKLILTVGAHPFMCAQRRCNESSHDGRRQ